MVSVTSDPILEKPLKDQAAIQADNPGLFEACIVLESNRYGARTILYQGSMEIAERIMTCWNVQLGVESKNIHRKN